MSRVRTAVFAGVVVLLTLGAAELLSRIALRFRYGSWSGAPPVAPASSAAPFAGGPRMQEPPDKVLHPFLGFVRDPRLPAPSDTPPVNASGFRRWPDEENATGAFTIALLGGSLAERFSYTARQTLVDELERLHVLPGRRKRVLNYAVGGYKEPQQLLALTYLLSLDEHPDVVVNLDGYNEVVLSTTDNLRHGINPFYPRRWAGAVQDIPDRARLTHIGELTFVRERRRAIATSCDGRVLAHSALCRLMLDARDSSLAARERKIAETLEERPAGEHDLEHYGPHYADRGRVELFRDMAAQWARCSVLIHQLSSARGIPYFHFLQPNQYVAGSKPMDAAERKVALQPSQPYAASATEGYPDLIREGEALAKSGVVFRDLTQIFRRTTAPVYIDDCCHVNALGNAILGREIARTIAERLTATPSPPAAVSETP